jgi:hypothetical protein
MAGKSLLGTVQAAHSHGEIVEAFEPAIAPRAHQHAGIETPEADDAILASIGAHVPRRAEIADGQSEPREPIGEAPGVELVRGKHVVGVSEIATGEAALQEEPGLGEAIDAHRLHRILAHRLAGGIAVDERR